MKISIAAMRSWTRVKMPRRIACRVTIPKGIFMLAHDAEKLLAGMLGPHALRH